MLVAVALALAALARTAYCIESISELLQRTYWGEGSEFKSAPLGRYVCDDASSTPHRPQECHDSFKRAMAGQSEESLRGTTHVPKMCCGPLRCCHGRNGIQREGAGRRRRGGACLRS